LRLRQISVILCINAICCGHSIAQGSGPQVPEQFKEPQQISEYVREVFQDRENNLWFGTNNEGVARYDGNALSFLSTEQGLAGVAIRGILQDTTGDMWFATNHGVSRYNGDRFTNYTTDNGLSDNEIWCIFEDSNGTIWVGTIAGVCRFDGESFAPFPIPRTKVDHPANRFGPHVVWSIFEDMDKNLWFGTEGEGARKYDGQSFTSYTTKEGLAGNAVLAISGDRNGNIWFATRSGGVSRYDGTTFHNLTQADGPLDNEIYEIREDRTGNIWFSVRGQGVARYDGTSFTSFGKKDGLTFLHVQEIFEDNTGIIWLGCSGGLFIYDGESFTNVLRKGPWPDIKLISLKDWLSETIIFPPGFAQELPTGKEDLRFPPGWRKPDSEDFWSYAIVMQIDEPAPNAERLEEILDLYYDGLMSAFGVGRDSEEPIDPAQVKVVKTGKNHYEAAMHIIDGFATFKPIDIRIKLVTESASEYQSIIKLRASPQPDEHPIWDALQTGIDDIEKP